MSKIHPHVLIAEDEKPLAHALELKLGSIGCQVTVAHDGQEAIELLQKMPFDLLLLDLMMPIMDGFQVLAQARTLQPQTTIFVLSNLGQAEDEKRALAMGAKRYYIKSSTPLAALVRDIGKLE
ncbi:MAG TPA: response regulator [Candidatus Saccharimonadales bacterium]